MFTLKINNQIRAFYHPLIMGILNVTDDSFYDGGTSTTEKEILTKADRIISQGADIIDIGACSTRPNANFVSEKEEITRIEKSLSVIRQKYPDVIISIDTFRSKVAEISVNKYQANIINDISAGNSDPKMFDTIANLQVPYILTHSRIKKNNINNGTYNNITNEVIYELSEKLKELKSRNICDIIIDPGFGFSKNLEQNYELMKNIDFFRTFEHPLLVGISRKSMIYKLTNETPQEALAGTTGLNAFCFLNNIEIIRVHDIAEAVRLKTVIEALKK